MVSVPKSGRRFGKKIPPRAFRRGMVRYCHYWHWPPLFFAFFFLSCFFLILRQMGKNERLSFPHFHVSGTCRVSVLTRRSRCNSSSSRYGYRATEHVDPTWSRKIRCGGDSHPETPSSPGGDALVSGWRRPRLRVVWDSRELGCRATELGRLPQGVCGTHRRIRYPSPTEPYPSRYQVRLEPTQPCPLPDPTATLTLTATLRWR